MELPVATRVLPVSGHAKVVDLAENIFFPQDIGGATYIAYASNRNVVGFQLNGSADEMMLDGLRRWAAPMILKCVLNRTMDHGEAAGGILLYPRSGASIA